MPEKEKPGARMACPDRPRERGNIPDQSIPAAMSKSTYRNGSVERATVSAMVIGINDIAGLAKRQCKTVIAKGVLRGCMRNLNDPPRRPRWRVPAVGGDRQMISSGGETRFDSHVFLPCQPCHQILPGPRCCCRRASPAGCLCRPFRRCPRGDRPQPVHTRRLRRETCPGPRRPTAGAAHPR
jgi:hypothetical protein